MIKIVYPAIKPRIKQEGGKEQVFCLVRKRWVLLTPEEWVRQNFLLYLTEVLKFPVTLIAVEKQLMLGDVKKRFDIVVFDREVNAFMLVECKEMNVPLAEQVLNQALRYNSALLANWMVITNGSTCVAFRRAGNSMEIADSLPGPV